MVHVFTKHYNAPPVLAALRNLRALYSPAAFTPATPQFRNERYRQAPVLAPWRIAPTCDIYTPDKKIKRNSSILLVHGGAFVLGSKQMKPMRFLATRFVNAGFTVCVVDYRMVYRGGRMAEGLSDVTDAIDFWRGRAQTLGLDAEQIALVGVSAGATLSLMAASDPSVASQINRIVSIFGLYDLEVLQGRLPGIISRMALGSRSPELQRQHSPVNAQQAPCPLMLVHGTKDGLVPVEQAYRLESIRQTLNYPTQLAIYDGLRHGFFNHVNAGSEQAVLDIIAFLEATP